MASERTSEEPQASSSGPGGILLKGTSVSPGLVLGAVHRKDYDLARAVPERVPREGLELELNRFRQALEDSRSQLVDLRGRLEGQVKEDDARILDTHLTYLRDSVFIADVEGLILGEQMRLEAAISKVVSDFDRIFRLVENETLRQSAVDLRDVGIRVLRNLEARDPASEDVAAPEEYVLVARELSIVDMFNLAGDQVKGIVTEEGGMTSHAAIFARSMGIPTVIGIGDLLEHVDEGDYLILDAAEATLQVNPNELVRAQYMETLSDSGSRGTEAAAEVPEWALRAKILVDGEALVISASCGNLPEVEQARESGMGEVGLYRTELLYLVDRSAPSLDALVHHYSAVISAARGGRVTFRLLNVDSSVELKYLHAERERNPALGRFGLRALLDNPVVLRRQLRALLMAGHGSDIRIALPHLTDCGDVRKVKEMLFEERIELRKKGERFQDKVAVGCTIVLPVAFLGVVDLAQESDFLMINLDSLQQYMMAADRENPSMLPVFERLHPFLLRGLISIVEAASAAEIPLVVHGFTARQPVNVPLLVGAGLRNFSVPPSEYRNLLDAFDQVDVNAVGASALSAARSTCVEEMDSLVGKYQHGSPRL